ncbi:MAG: hypothetical protein QXI36_05090 [Candidatus Bathyarchaeia archaeon]
MPHSVSLVELYLFERSSSIEAFLKIESDKLGVTVTPFGESFFAMHDAWRGIPRITICLEKIRTLPKPVKIGGIRHEVAHTILHGSLEYYAIPTPPALLEIADRFNLSSDYTRNLLYLVSIAVKDYEVTRLLYNRGYVEDQVEYVKYLLRASEEDVASWGLSKGKPLLEILCLISSLKTVGCTTPLLNDGRFCQELKQLLVESLSYLPGELSAMVLKFAEEGFPKLGMDTFENINSIIRRCKPIFKAVFH